MSREPHRLAGPCINSWILLEAAYVTAHSCNSRLYYVRSRYWETATLLFTMCDTKIVPVDPEHGEKLAVLLSSVSTHSAWNTEGDDGHVTATCCPSDLNEVHVLGTRMVSYREQVVGLRNFTRVVELEPSRAGRWTNMDEEGVYDDGVAGHGLVGRW